MFVMTISNSEIKKLNLCTLNTRRLKSALVNQNVQAKRKKINMRKVDSFVHKSNSLLVLKSEQYMLQTGTAFFTIFGSKIIIAARTIQEKQSKLNTSLSYIHRARVCNL